MSEYIFKLPDLGEGTVEAEIAEWMVKMGDLVQEEDTICAMLTDKAAVELTAPVSGRVSFMAGAVGDTIGVGTPLIIFDTVTEAATAAKKPERSATPENKDQVTAGAPVAAATAVKPASVPLQPDSPVRTSPSIRQRARETGIDLNQVRGNGPQGRILQADFDAYLAASLLPAAAAAPAPVGSNRTAGATEIKVIGLRRKIAQRMQQANQEVPHFAYVEEVDVTELESLRRHLNSNKAAGEDTLTLLPFIGLALLRVLAQFPQCNAHYDKERNVLIQHHAVHLGIATQTSDGLKVPVVRHAEAHSLTALAAEIRRVTSAARDNTASREELSGSTITLTSLGKLGGIASTPIINLPEVAIIGVNKAVERPVVQHGQMVIRLMMNLSSSFDHRFVDGYDAAAMIQALKQMLEQPATIFMSG
jgi:2-oxoisovalerate dehydrogenase E2 component (dihydrolipoyl transacylase)